MLNRRTFIAGSAAIAGAPSLAAAPAKHTPFDPNDVAQSTRAFLKLSGSLGTETVRLWFTGKILAYFPGEQVREVCLSDGFYLSHYEARGDGTHLATRYEVTVKRDIKTGNLLKTYDNLFTRRTDDVAFSVGGPQRKLYNAYGFDKPERPRGPDNPLILPWTIVGDEAWVHWDLFLRFKNPLQPATHPLKSSGEMLNLTNLTNYRGKLSDIENPDVLNAPSTMFWNGVSGWQPWMRMGQRKGTLIYKAIGVKVQSFRDIPQDVFAAAEEAHPGHLSEERPWAEGSYEWFDEGGADWDSVVNGGS
ncbi:MAG: DUF1838 family protein [Pseudomonadota bacterium]